MKPNKSFLLFFAFGWLLLAGCNKILNKTPLDKYPEASVFSDINLADSYLMDAYNSSLIGDFGYVGFASLTDESHDTHGFETANYLQGNISSFISLPCGSWTNSWRCGFPRRRRMWIWRMRASASTRRLRW